MRRATIPAGPERVSNPLAWSPGEDADRRRQVRGFVLRALLAWGAVFTALALFPAIGEWTITGTVASFRALFDVLRADVAIAGDVLGVGGITVRIVTECTSLGPTVILWGAIAAYPATLRRKVVGLVGAAIALWLYNMARVLVLIPVLAQRPELFDAAHAFVWQAVTPAAVLVLFFLWLRLPARGGSAA